MSSFEAVSCSPDTITEPFTVVLFDVDGTLLVPSNASNPGYSGVPGREGLSFNRTHGPFITSLIMEQVADVRWLSMRGPEANQSIGRHLGIDLPAVKYFNDGSIDGDIEGRMRAIDDQFSGRPVMWVDDAVGDNQRAWALRRTIHDAPTEILPVTAEFGMQDLDIAHIRRWVHMQTAARAA
jgi:hypothetical protein